MKIPVLNIYYLLCYAWNHIEEGETVDLESEDFEEPVDLFAKVLNEGVSRLIRRGLDRDYFAIHEDIRGIKGKLDLATTMKRNLLLSGKAHCSFDELSYDVPQNQILKAILRCLMQVDSLNKKEKQQSEHLYRKLSAVSDVRLTANMFHTVRIHRNNRFYRFLLHICQIIHEHLLVNKSQGTAQFLDFRGNDQKMGAVFEEFVRNFYIRKTNYQVRAEKMNWFDAKGSDCALKHLPEMRTDIVLQSSERTIIIDTKYYNLPLVPMRGDSKKKKVRSAHLYQISSYVTNWAAKASDNVPAPEGWLLYAAVDRNFDFRFELSGRRFRVCSINLSQEWRKIEEDLLSLVGENYLNGATLRVREKISYPASLSPVQASAPFIVV